MADVTEVQNEIETPAPKRRSKAKEAAAPEETPAVLTFKQKMLELQRFMGDSASKVEFDKVQSFGGKSTDYADTQQYKTKLAQACNTLGIIVSLSFDDDEFLGVVAEGGKGGMFATRVSGTIKFADVDSDEFEVDRLCGLGTNVGPGFTLGVAQTNALRNYLLNRFMLDNRGRDGDDQAAMNIVDSGRSGYVSPDEKAAIKQNIMRGTENTTKYATDMFATALYEKIVEAQKYKPEFASAVLAEHFNADGTPILREDGFSTIPKAEATKGMLRAEEIIGAGDDNG